VAPSTASAAPSNVYVLSQRCNVASGDVSLTLKWQPKLYEQRGHVDVSVLNNGFAAGTFGTVAAQVPGRAGIADLLSETDYYVRVRDNLGVSPTFLVRTIACEVSSLGCEVLERLDDRFKDAVDAAIASAAETSDFGSFAPFAGVWGGVWTAPDGSAFPDGDSVIVFHSTAQDGVVLVATYTFPTSEAAQTHRYVHTIYDPSTIISFGVFNWRLSLDGSLHGQLFASGKLSAVVDMVPCRT
jgi:hypothetical protein